MKIAIQLREVFKYSLANFSEDKKTKLRDEKYKVWKYYAICHAAAIHACLRDLKCWTTYYVAYCKICV